MSEGCSAYRSACAFLPEHIRKAALSSFEDEHEKIEEIRLRTGRPPTLCLSHTEKALSISDVTNEDIAQLVESVTGSSLHNRTDELRNGFLSVKGGHRLGLCGTAVIKDGHTASIRNFTSANLRIAREIKGAAASLASAITDGGRIHGTLIVSPPGAGKTTLLRDLIRLLSDGVESVRKFRIAVADERGELAACSCGIPQFDLGASTDVMELCPKAESMEMMLRSMSPDAIAVDEITSERDVRAMERAIYCGVSLIATAHAFGAEDFKNRPVYKLLRGAGIFENIVPISVYNGIRRYEVKKAEDHGGDIRW